MYAFVFGLNGKVIFGRDWKDFLDICAKLQSAYGLNEKRRLAVYVHNFAFEFQWFRMILHWLDVFATDDRKPIRALTSFGIEFRDSYILSGMSLESTAKNLTKYKIMKLKGDLDYSLPRHSRTILNPDEWHYIENDGLSLMAFVQETIELNHNNICNIPMTKTGYVRKYMKNQCYHGGNAGHGARRKIKTRDYQKYKNLMENMKLSSEEYILAVEEFQGGFTHGNNFNVGLIFDEVTSYDLTSAYPSAMVLERYPMGMGTRLESPTNEIVEKYLNLYACLFRVKIWGIYTRYRGDNFLSFSKCRNVQGEELDNGRIICADYLETTMTEIDLEIIKAFYKFDKIEFSDFWYYPRGYLPTNYIKGILKLYSDKTRLKDVEGMEVEYQVSKGMINGVYGMSVTSVDMVNHKYKDGTWYNETPSLEETLEKYNESPNRFSSYLWGIFTTCHVRKLIARSIIELGDDYIYADTDSVKFIHAEKHKRFFDEFNERIMKKIELSARVNNLPIELYKPKTKKGSEKPIGLFDYEYTAKRFKTLGAKRYFVEYHEPHKLGEYETRYSLTISGVNKFVAVPQLEKRAKNEKRDIFDYFEIGFEFDEDMAGKNLRTYCDKEIKGYLTDWRGKKFHYHEYSFIHLEPTTYKLTTTEEYYQMIYLDAFERLERRENQRL